MSYRIFGLGLGSIFCCGILSAEKTALANANPADMEALPYSMQLLQDLNEPKLTDETIGEGGLNQAETAVVPIEPAPPALPVPAPQQAEAAIAQPFRDIPLGSLSVSSDISKADAEKKLKFLKDSKVDTAKPAADSAAKAATEAAAGAAPALPSAAGIGLVFEPVRDNTGF